jgi:hypothetical protein
VQIALTTRLCRKSDVLFAPVDDDNGVLLSIDAGRYFGLNAVAMRIWELIANPMTVADVCDRLGEEFDVDAPHCLEAVTRFVSEMADTAIVEVV